MDFSSLALPTPKSSECGSDVFYAGLTPSQPSRKPQNTSSARVQGGCRPPAPSHWPSHQHRRRRPHLCREKRGKQPKCDPRRPQTLIRHGGWARAPLPASPIRMADHARLRGSSRVDGRAPMSTFVLVWPPEDERDSGASLFTSSSSGLLRAPARGAGDRPASGERGGAVSRTDSAWCQTSSGVQSSAQFGGSRDCGAKFNVMKELYTFRLRT